MAETRLRQQTLACDTSPSSLGVSDVAAVVKVTGCVLLAAELGPDSPLPVVMETRTHPESV